MALYFCRAKNGEQFKDQQGQIWTAIVPPIKGGKTCKCKTFANAVKEGYESSVESHRNTLQEYSDVPEYMKVFKSQDIIEPPTKKETEIICCFPGVGEVEFANTSVFIENIDKERFIKNFPNVYLQRLTNELKIRRKYLLVCADHQIREKLQSDNKKYTLVYPGRELKEEYLNRTAGKKHICEDLEKNWDAYIDACECDENKKIVLKSGEFLSEKILKNV